ncbi:hypothetical protein SNEBB_011232 [Seison nebaliae]|nr:hypothetical protein SNEBB_011232 [Seison nebaliae]
MSDSTSEYSRISSTTSKSTRKSKISPKSSSLSFTLSPSTYSSEDVKSSDSSITSSTSNRIGGRSINESISHNGTTTLFTDTRTNDKLTEKENLMNEKDEELLNELRNDGTVENTRAFLRQQIILKNNQFTNQSTTVDRTEMIFNWLISMYMKERKYLLTSSVFDPEALLSSDTNYLNSFKLSDILDVLLVNEENSIQFPKTFELTLDDNLRNGKKQMSDIYSIPIPLRQTFFFKFISKVLTEYSKTNSEVALPIDAKLKEIDRRYDMIKVKENKDYESTNEQLFLMKLQLQREKKKEVEEEIGRRLTDEKNVMRQELLREHEVKYKKKIDLLEKEYEKRFQLIRLKEERLIKREDEIKDKLYSSLAKEKEKILTDLSNSRRIINESHERYRKKETELRSWENELNKRQEEIFSKENDLKLKEELFGEELEQVIDEEKIKLNERFNLSSKQLEKDFLVNTQRYEKRIEEYEERLNELEKENHHKRFLLRELNKKFDELQDDFDSLTDQKKILTLRLAETQRETPKEEIEEIVSGRLMSGRQSSRRKESSPNQDLLNMLMAHMQTMELKENKLQTDIDLLREKLTVIDEDVLLNEFTEVNRKEEISIDENDDDKLMSKRNLIDDDNDRLITEENKHFSKLLADSEKRIGKINVDFDGMNGKEIDENVLENDEKRFREKINNYMEQLEMETDMNISGNWKSEEKTAEKIHSISNNSQNISMDKKTTNVDMNEHGDSEHGDVLNLSENMFSFHSNNENVHSKDNSFNDDVSKSYHELAVTKSGIEIVHESSSSSDESSVNNKNSSSSPSNSISWV